MRIRYRKFGVEWEGEVSSVDSLLSLPVFNDWFPDHDYCAALQSVGIIQSCFQGDYFRWLPGPEWQTWVEVGARRKGDVWWLTNTLLAKQSLFHLGVGGLS